MKNRLKELREERDLTLKGLAELLKRVNARGWDWRTISNYENGKSGASNELIEALAVVLKVKPKEIDGAYEPPPTNVLGNFVFREATALMPDEVEMQVRLHRKLYERLEAQADRAMLRLDNLVANICVEYLRGKEEAK